MQLQTSGTSLTLDTTWTYDADGRLTDEIVTSTDTTKVYTDHFDFDLNNNRVSKTHLPGGGSLQVTVYSFNADDQLVVESPGDGQDEDAWTRYSYDANGSQIEVTNVENARDDTYTYDLRNKMVSATVDNTTSTYVYDDDGNRVQQTTGGVTSKYLTDENNPSGYAQPIERKTNNSTAPATTYLTGDRVFAQTDNADTNSVIYLLLDGHGSTQQVTSSSGAIVQAIQYDCFGSGINGSPLIPTHTVYLFGGDAMYDPASGLYLHGDGTRPRDGFRFIQDDDRQYGSNANPISLNLSLYANGNTINGVDRSGHFAEFEALFAANLGLNIDISGSNVARAFGKTLGIDTEVYDVSAFPSIESNPYGPLAQTLAWIHGFSEGERQGLANALNGVTDAFVGLANLAIQATPEASIAEALGVNLSIPTPDWSQGLVYYENPTEHSVSKFLGGQGILTLASVGLGAAISRAGDIHHVATVCNADWTPMFEDLFDQADLEMEDAVNKVRVADHVGPHPEEYHQTVYRRLLNATSGKSGDAFSDALFNELMDMSRECATPGTLLNHLITNRF